MTTIVYKDGVIAYDSRVTRGTMIDDDEVEKCTEIKGVKFILAGPGDEFDLFINAYFGTPYTVRSLETGGLVLDGGNLFFVGHGAGCGLWKDQIHLDKCFALGSGKQHAYTAMDMGASAHKAVEMAIKRDTCSGGLIRTLLLPDLKLNN